LITGLFHSTFFACLCNESERLGAFDGSRAKISRHCGEGCGISQPSAVKAAEYVHESFFDFKKFSQPVGETALQQPS
jgi:hypothetical protein